MKPVAVRRSGCPRPVRVTWRHPIFDMPARSFLRFELDEKGSITGLVVTFYDPIRFERQ